MKILLLLSGLLFSGGLFASPMDNTCMVYYKDISRGIALPSVCERNNVLYLMSIPADFLILTIGGYCRHDREINYLRNTKGTYDLSCVVYQQAERRVIID